VQLDITEFEKIYLPVQQRPLIHPYSDSAQCAASIRCQQTEEILVSKLTTLLHRREAIDFFDCPIQLFLLRSRLKIDFLRTDSSREAPI
jgi:hypothetical protein